MEELPPKENIVYSYEEALNESLKYFDNDELAAKVFVDKYLLKDNEGKLLEKSPTDMHWRIAKEFARIESGKFKKPWSAGEIFSVLDRFKYVIPQGSPMFGIGNNYQYVSLSNCYVLEIPEDSYGSILKTDEQLIQISKRRGGTGIDLSNLRPAGVSTKNAAKSSTGIIPFMERYSNSIREVGQNNRRGALMLTLSVHHPEVLEFTTIKNDRRKVTGANISLRLTQEFLDAVVNDKEYELRFPIDYKERGIKPLISKLVKASEIWKVIIKNARDCAEPGLLMWDNIIKNGPADCYEEYKSVSTNPCLPGWAKLLTPSGIRNLININIGDFIWSKDGWTKVINKWSNGIKKVNRYGTTAGSFYGTENHHIISNNESVEAKDAITIDFITGEYKKDIIFNNQDIMDGLVIGDGSVHKASNNLVYLNVGENDSDYLNSEIKDLLLKHRLGLTSIDCAYEIKTTISVNELPYTYLRNVPNRYLFGDRNKICSFLRGLYSANGSIIGGRVTLKAASFQIIEDVQLMLSSIGIFSYYTTNKSHKVKFSNGEYLCKESYDLNITRDKVKFLDTIGFIQKYKNEKLINIISKQDKCDKPFKSSYDIKEVEFVSEEEIFDITVDNMSHTFWCTSACVSNCSEIPLSPLDSCRLMCLNLFSYVKNPFKENAAFDYKKFHEHAKITQRLMDDMIDLESEKIDKIIEKIKNDPESIEIKDRELKLWQKIKKYNDEGRRTGTGITALGDTLAALNMKYGSEESIKKTERIYRALKLACYESSVEMAEELGPFKCWDYEKEKNNPFLLRIKDEDSELYERMKKNGRRNIALNTTAPTGSVSVLSQTTSGIEPLFQMSYIRRRKINPDDKNVRIDFIDQIGDKWQEFKVYHPKLKLWMEITGENNEKKSPWFGSCAEEIDWINRVKLQAVAQKHVCHAISSTLNLPENVSEDVVSQIYKTAFENGLKGITIYRKNCRTGVLIDDNEEKKTDKIPRTKAPKRPKELPGAIHHFTLNKQRYYVIVGLLSGEPYEVFAGINHNDDGEIIIPKNVEDGLIVREEKGKYNFISYSPISGVSQWHLTNGSSDDTGDALTRLISTSLRHGSPLEFIVEQLSKTRGPMTSFSKILARTLKKYVINGTISTENCSECKTKLIFSEGCYKCPGCGYSKCG